MSLSYHIHRLYALGDIVQVIEDPFRNFLNMYHPFIGCISMVSHIEFTTAEITMTESLSFLLESYIPEQPVWAPFNVSAPPVDDSTECIQIGDIVKVKTGSHRGFFGCVIKVKQLVGTLKILSQHCPLTLLQSQADQGYDMQKGDPVVVVRGDFIARSGVISQLIFTLPIMHFAHAVTMSDHDETNFYCGKEVLIIAGAHKGWQSHLVSVGENTCVVAQGAFTCETYPRNNVVIRTPIPDVPSEHDNEPLEAVGSSIYNHWVVDNADHVEAGSFSFNSSFNFLLHPDVMKSLEHFQAVFQISPGWHDKCTGHLAKTETSSPFQGPSGPVTYGHLAVCLMARAKGAQLLVQNILERLLQPYAPVKKNMLCMVIKDKKGGGERIRSVLSVMKISFKKKKVIVR
ncbi:hypothetical protein J3R82DRAFT_2176 [Butyriboletus roseoflavus]|nr:hypothetical protein J3R82DRAFT_2176 [Butyriboletus roseoflavus]